MISERKKNILRTIIQEYLQTTQAVSSGVLVKKYNLNISPATVRNEMAELEEEGYIFQPHTSSGRIPTELAYELELAEIIKEKPLLTNHEQNKLIQIFAYEEGASKQTAKLIAELSGCAVFWAFHKNDLYYTGLSNLFSQPEFKQVEIVYDISVIIDRMEEIIDSLFDQLPIKEQVLIGPANPFGNFLSTVLVKYKKNGKAGIFGIMGPMRMDYAKNIALVNFIKDKFK